MRPGVPNRAHIVAPGLACVNRILALRYTIFAVSFRPMTTRNRKECPQ
ncbi:hypothetical protein Shy_CDS0034 [Escherichia phage Shy]|nr:hypothetical protein Shy_CDS0034 [Escherichia phage Shy]